MLEFGTLQRFVRVHSIPLVSEMLHRCVVYTQGRRAIVRAVRLEPARRGGVSLVSLDRGK